MALSSSAADFVEGTSGVWDRDVDVVLVGSGAGSLAAAGLLVRHGLTPLIVEKSCRIGGATAYSGGIVWAPNNHRMRGKGLADSRQEALAYLEAVSCGRGDRQVWEAYVDAVPRIVADLQCSTRMRWVTYPDLPDYYAELPGGKMSGRFLLPHPALVADALDAAGRQWPEMSLVRPSVHRGEQRNEWAWGRALIGCLWARALEDGAPYLLDHRAVALVRHGERVVGVTLSGPRQLLNVRARRGVLLNTGGFEWNDALNRQFVPGPRLHPQTPPTNEGDGYAMAARIGAGLALMDQTIGMPSVCVAGETNAGVQLYRILFQELALPHSLVVNASGRRFANETYFVDVARAWAVRDAECRWANLPCFLIFDETYRRKYGYPAGLSPPVSVCRRGSLEELAAAIRVDPVGLCSEVGAFNSMIQTEGRDRLGRGGTPYQRAFGDKNATGNPTLGVVDEPPFHAVEIHPATSGHRGGVVIDGDAQVLDVQGKVIPGLFACGTCAAGTLTGGNYFTGAAVGHSIVFGTLAAERIIADHSS